MSEILEIGVNNVIEEPFTAIEVHSYVPYINSFGNNDVIRIGVHHQEQCLIPSRSSIHIQGKFTRRDGERVVNGTNLVTNAICHLFSEIRYDLNSVTIDRCKNAGITSVMKGYPSINSSCVNALQITGWHPGEILDANGNFDVLIPLSMLFGFAEDFQKIVCNAKHELILTRSNTDINSIIQTAAANADVDGGNFVFSISKMAWMMPYLIPSDYNKAKLLKFLEKKPTLKMSFRSWELYEYPRLPLANKQVWNVKTSNQLEKPRFVILGLQTGVQNRRTANASMFHHCNITNVKLFLNSQHYPYNNLNLNFNENQYSLLYDMFLNFQSSYYGHHKSESIIQRDIFRNTCPLIIFDCSYQNEATKYGPVDVRLEFEAQDNIPADTTAYCLIIHDRLVEYKPMEGDVRVMTQ